MVLNIIKLNIKLILLVCFLLGSIQQVYCQSDCTLQRKEVKVISSFFNANTTAEPVVVSPVIVSNPEIFYPDDCIYAITESGNLKGYLISTHAKGRYDYFDYSIIFSEELVLLHIFVTVYRSDHGAAICQKHWLSQFEGYNGGILMIGKDIDAVSGGTISAHAIVDGVYRSHMLISAIHQSQQNQL
jgi:hypothetical protein